MGIGKEDDRGSVAARVRITKIFNIMYAGIGVHHDSFLPKKFIPCPFVWW